MLSKLRGFVFLYVRVNDCFNIWSDNAAVTECVVISGYQVLLLRFYLTFFSEICLWQIKFVMVTLNA